VPRPVIMFVIGLTIGLFTPFWPVFIGFLPLLALAVPRDRFKSLALVVVGAAPAGSALACPQTCWRKAWPRRRARSPCPLVIAAYSDYVFNGDPRTFPFPQSYDPDFLKNSASVAAAAAEVLRKVEADHTRGDVVLHWPLACSPPWARSWSGRRL
jgi:hypothetical protein